MSERPARILPVIIVSQFAGTSLWFAGNAVMADLQRDWALGTDSLGHVTSAVQFGFIAGTFVFALLAVADRWSPRLVFFVCSVVASLANITLLAVPGELGALLACRFATGFFLAGIYPVGMKIAAGWYRDGLGKALGYLVGALVLGTAFPHLLRSLGQAWPWQHVLMGTSLIAAAGGVLMLCLVPDGPHLVRGTSLRATSLVMVFASSRFRASACGYFGHMWELYAFWAFVPVVVVVGDSPQFSAFNARNAPPAAVGSALTAGNCIGFALTIASIQLLNVAARTLPIEQLFLLLAPGPVLGLIAMRSLLREDRPPPITESRSSQP